MKKLISILLSAVLAVSMFGVSASARTLGDVNSDKSANSVDALKILQYSVGLNTELNKTYADVNCDGNVNSADALIVLTISVGSYSKPTQVDLKPEIIDPVISSGKYTFSTTVDVEGTVTPVTVMVNGKNMCTAMKADGINIRLLILDGKAYMILPDLKMYVNASDAGIDGDFTFGDIGDGSGQIYAGSKYVTENGKTYTVDTYKTADGAVSDYYFLNGKWAKLVGDPSDSADAMEITEFKAGVDSSWFSLKGLIEIDPSDLG